MNPDRLLARMPARLLAEWQAYFTLEPFGPPATFWQAGLITSMVRNVNRAKSSDKMATPEDFMPPAMTQREPRELEPEDQARMITDRFQALADLDKIKRQHGQ